MRRINLLALLAVLALSLAACEGDADRDLAFEDVPPTFDLTGRWRPGADAEPCRDNHGNVVPVPPPTDAVIEQRGHAISVLVTRSGITHYGRIAGEHFYLENDLPIQDGSCHYEFSATVFSADEFSGVERIECSDGSSAECPNSHMIRID